MPCGICCWQNCKDPPTTHPPTPSTHPPTQDLAYSPDTNRWVLEDGGARLNLTAPLQLELTGADSGAHAQPSCSAQCDGLGVHERCGTGAGVHKFACAGFPPLPAAGANLTATLGSLASQPLTGTQFPLQAAPAPAAPAPAAEGPLAQAA